MSKYLLSKKDDSPVYYDLFAVSVHSGGLGGKRRNCQLFFEPLSNINLTFSPAGGHYTAFCVKSQK